MPKKVVPAAPAPETLLPLELLPIASLRPHPRNDGHHPPEERAHLRQSIEEHGIYRNVVVANDGTILAGHGVIEAAREAGHTHVPGHRKPYGPDDPRAHELLVGDNHIARLRMQDDAQLVALLQDLTREDPLALLGTGFDEEAMEDLITQQRSIFEGEGTPGHGQEQGAPSVGNLAARFLIPPFSVLDARQGYWQARKRAWIALGIQSELGRGEAIVPNGSLLAASQDGVWRRQGTDNGLLGESQQARSHYKATPGGALRDVTTLGKDGHTQRGDGRGKVFARTEGSGAPGELATAYKQKRLTWPHDEREVPEMDDTSRKILAAGRKAHTVSTDTLMDWAGGFSASHQSGTSIFDPVLCELVYRWFCHREEQLVKLKAEYDADPASVLARNNARYHRDLEASRTKARVYAWNNRAHFRPLAKASAEKRRQADPVHIQALRQAKTLRERAKEAELPLLWNASYAERALAWWKHQCAYCGTSLRDGFWHRLHWDHFVPVTNAACPGTVPWNLLPVCGPSPHNGTGRDVPLCNSSKNNRKPEEWLLYMMVLTQRQRLGHVLTEHEERACKGAVTRKLKKIGQFFKEMTVLAETQGDTPTVQQKDVVAILTP